MSRTRLSKPLQLAREDGLLVLDHSVFDYGCGRGGDVRHLLREGFEVSGWDPAHAPEVPRRAADVVNLGYVLNVIENARERVITIQNAWELARSVLVVAARPDWEASSVRGRAHGDGLITSKGTFQKFFAQDELRSLIGAACQREPVAAAPGVFYVFRNDADASRIKARRFRHRRSSTPRPRVADQLWDQHRELLEPIAAFWEERGRQPERWEVPNADEVGAAVGSLRRAAGIVRRIVGDDRFSAAAAAAADDLLVFVALEAFGGRPRFSELPDDVQLDIRAHFGSYKSTCAAADELLFSMADEGQMDKALRSVPFGKVLPDAVYVHADYVQDLPPLVRVYEGAARALLGVVQNTTLVKMSRRERRVSYLSYPRFERDPHPALETSLRADLRTFHVKWRDYRESQNPPVLHRKETFVPLTHPTREKFARLTRQEERAGLFDEPSAIGTRSSWTAVLDESGKRLRGHRLVPA